MTEKEREKEKPHWNYDAIIGLYLEGGVERLVNEAIKKFSSIEYNTDNKFCVIQNDEQSKGQYEQHGWIRQREAEYSIYKSNSNQCNSHWLAPYTSLPNSSVSFSILSTSGIRRIPAIWTRVHSVSLSMEPSKHADISHWVPLSKMDTGVWADTKVQVTSDLYVLVIPQD